MMFCSSMRSSRSALVPHGPWRVSRDALAHAPPRAASASTVSASSAAPAPAQPFAAPRGTRDYAGPEARARELVEAAFVRAARRRGYGRVETPVFESMGVFARTLGDASDVVMKEMYAVAAPSRGGGEKASEKDQPPLALRPEGTAGVMRALVSGALASASAAGAAGAGAATGDHRAPAAAVPLPPLPTPSSPFRLYYSGPMFRHERPQKGRYRQFTQLGLEFAGAGSWQADVETMDVADKFLRDVLPVTGGRGTGAEAGTGDNTASAATAPRLTLLVNTLGEDLRPYSSALASYFSSHAASLSPDSRARLDRGSPLRILDSKAPADADIVRGAPALASFLPEAALARFDAVLGGLTALGIPHRVDPRLVRGLDYYSHTVFEFVVEEEEGGGQGAATTTKQGGPGQLGTVLAGGRYDRLSTMLGARERIPCVGSCWEGRGGKQPSVPHVQHARTHAHTRTLMIPRLSISPYPLPLSLRRMGRRPRAAVHPRRLLPPRPRPQAPNHCRPARLRRRLRLRGVLRVPCVSPRRQRLRGGLRRRARPPPRTRREGVPSPLLGLCHRRRRGRSRRGGRGQGRRSDGQEPAQRRAGPRGRLRAACGWRRERGGGRRGGEGPTGVRRGHARRRGRGRGRRRSAVVRVCVVVARSYSFAHTQKELRLSRRGECRRGAFSGRRRQRSCARAWPKMGLSRPCLRATESRTARPGASRRTP
jgi:histidyl-tRNA synthetase